MVEPTGPSCSSTLPEGGWSARTWQHASVEGVYDAILGHPFLRGLADGTLPEETFRHYLAQVKAAEGSAAIRAQHARLGGPQGTFAPSCRAAGTPSAAAAVARAGRQAGRQAGRLPHPRRPGPRTGRALPTRVLARAGAGGLQGAAPRVGGLLLQLRQRDLRRGARVSHGEGRGRRKGGAGSWAAGWLAPG